MNNKGFVGKSASSLLWISECSSRRHVETLWKTSYDPPPSRVNGSTLTCDTYTWQLFEAGDFGANIIHGPHVTFVDPRNFNDARSMVGEARRRSQLFIQRGFTAENILISVSCFSDSPALEPKNLHKVIVNSPTCVLFTDPRN